MWMKKFFGSYVTGHFVVFRLNKEKKNRFQCANYSAIFYFHFSFNNLTNKKFTKAQVYKNQNKMLF